KPLAEYSCNGVDVGRWSRCQRPHELGRNATAQCGIQWQAKIRSVFAAAWCGCRSAGRSRSNATSRGPGAPAPGLCQAAFGRQDKAIQLMSSFQSMPVLKPSTLSRIASTVAKLPAWLPERRPKDQTAALAGDPSDNGPCGPVSCGTSPAIL